MKDRKMRDREMQDQKMKDIENDRPTQAGCRETARPCILFRNVLIHKQSPKIGQMPRYKCIIVFMNFILNFSFSILTLYDLEQTLKTRGQKD